MLAVLATLACDDGDTAPSARAVVYHNGVIVTMDANHPLAEAILVQGDRIAEVGDAEALIDHAGRDATLVDLGGATIVPGFIDAHGHRVNNRFDEAGLPSNAASAQAALAQGWTGVHELYADATELADLRALDESGQLPLRVDAYLPVNSPVVEPLGEWYAAYRPGQMLSPHVRVAGLKLFVDRYTGTEIPWTQSELTSAFKTAHDEGWQIAAKAIGSRTLEMILNGVEQTQGGRRDIARRHRIEHILAVTPAQAQRMRDLGVIAVFQTNIPGQLVGEADIEALIAREPPGAYAPWRSLFAAGVPMAGGTGWPSYYIEEQDGPPFASPLRLLYQAVTRTGAHGSPPEPWMLAEAITVEQALRAYTLGSAYASFTDHERGSITEGKLADFVVLSANPLAVEVGDILRIRVLSTVVGGRVAFCAAGAELYCGQSTTRAGPTPTAGAPALEIRVVGPASGEAAALGPALTSAAEMAFEDLGAPSGAAVRLRLVDDQCSETGGVDAANNVVADRAVVAVIGPACSAAARAALPILESAGIPAVSGATTLPGLAGYAPTVFNRTVPHDDQLSAAGATVEGVNARPAVQEFYQRYSDRFGALPAATYRPYLAYTYDAAAVLWAALAMTVSVSPGGEVTVDRAALARALRATAGHTGITGPISFDAAGDRRP